ncbi:MAG TPA: hypothetical protein VGO33_00565 [Gemmatimonadaceae bacterium]|nr:hypothetical protein [Gemmatimonadaceae bacterium]
MRRRFLLVLLTVLVVIAVFVSAHHISRNRAARRVASVGAPRDSAARADSAAEAEARRSADTLCFASRLFLPCDPR